MSKLGGGGTIQHNKERFFNIFQDFVHKTFDFTCNSISSILEKISCFEFTHWCHTLLRAKTQMGIGNNILRNQCPDHSELSEREMANKLFIWTSPRSCLWWVFFSLAPVRWDLGKRRNHQIVGAFSGERAEGITNDDELNANWSEDNKLFLRLQT